MFTWCHLIGVPLSPYTQSRARPYFHACSRRRALRLRRRRLQAVVLAPARSLRSH
jgi:hypothetical protein